MRVAAVGLLLALAPAIVLACSAHPERPKLPPPEYERPVLPAWDAGVAASSDPLDDDDVDAPSSSAAGSGSAAPSGAPASSSGEPKDDGP